MFTSRGKSPVCDRRRFPTFRALFNTALAAGEIRGDIGADDFLNAAATLCMAAGDRLDAALGQVMLLVDGLRYRERHDGLTTVQVDLKGKASQRLSRP